MEKGENTQFEFRNTEQFKKLIKELEKNKFCSNFEEREEKNKRRKKKINHHYK